jgi:prepilin signal peptidase PulO-like enzyme (type II secretory pathway)
MLLPGAPTALALVLAPLFVAVLLAVVPLATRRNLVQPVEQDLDAERELVALLTAHPFEWLRVEELLTTSAFTDPACAVRYTQLDRAARPVLAAYAYRGDSDDELEEALSRARAELASTETAIARQLDQSASDPARLDTPAPDLSDVAARILDAGTRVLGAAAGRAHNTDRSPIGFEPHTLAPHRIHVRATTRRHVALVCVGLVAAVPSAILVNAFTSSLSRALSLLAVLTLTATSAEVGLVDLDTFYLDTPVFTLGALTASLFAILAQLADHHATRLLAGVVIAGAFALIFEGLAKAFSLLRGQTQGAGDTWIVLATAGIPSALTGSYSVGFFSMLAGCVLTIAFWLYQRLHNKATAQTAIAFGPFLALGAFCALALWALGCCSRL